jgi:hypothetical protein
VTTRVCVITAATGSYTGLREADRRVDGRDADARAHTGDDEGQLTRKTRRESQRRRANFGQAKSASAGTGDTRDTCSPVRSWRGPRVGQHRDSRVLRALPDRQPPTESTELRTQHWPSPPHPKQHISHVHGHATMRDWGADWIVDGRAGTEPAKELGARGELGGSRAATRADRWPGRRPSARPRSGAGATSSRTAPRRGSRRRAPPFRRSQRYRCAGWSLMMCGALVVVADQLYTGVAAVHAVQVHPEGRQPEEMLDRTPVDSFLLDSRQLLKRADGVGGHTPTLPLDDEPVSSASTSATNSRAPICELLAPRRLRPHRDDTGSTIHQGRPRRPAWLSQNGLTTDARVFAPRCAVGRRVGARAVRDDG